VKWDEVEREFFVIGSQLMRLSQSFQALAAALKRERQSGNPRGGDGHEPAETYEMSRGGDGSSEPSLPF